MEAAVSMTAGSTTSEVLPSRPVRLLRVAVLLLAGLGIAFTATMHGRLGFDLGVTSAVLGAIGASHLVEWFSLRGRGRNAVPLLLAIVAIASAVLLPATASVGGSVLGFAMVIAAWALASALLEFIGATTRPGTRQDSTLLGGIGILLALLVLLVREDQVAILGFFGAYSVIAGVFLGISAFDTRRTAPEQDAATAASRSH